MPASEFPHECCGELPVTVRSVQLTWCHAHQAYSVHWSVVTQHGDDPTVLRSDHLNLGPFDGPAELREVLDKACRSVFE